MLRRRLQLAAFLVEGEFVRAEGKTPGPSSKWRRSSPGGAEAEADGGLAAIDFVHNRGEPSLTMS